MVVLRCNVIRLVISPLEVTYSPHSTHSNIPLPFATLQNVMQVDKMSQGVALVSSHPLAASRTAPYKYTGRKYTLEVQGGGGGQKKQHFIL